VFLARYDYSGQVKEEMGSACSTNVVRGMHIDGKTRMKETTEDQDLGR
jgi:hypothetical protein